MVHSPDLNERQARELAPLLDNPEALIEALESVEGVTTAAKLHDAVTPHLPKSEQKKRAAAKRKPRSPKPSPDTVTILRADAEALLGGTADAEVMNRVKEALA